MPPIVVLILVVGLVAMVPLIRNQLRDRRLRKGIEQHFAERFGPPPVPGAGGPLDLSVPADRLTHELAETGRGRGFLSGKGRPRTREIGAELELINGKQQMLEAHEYVRAELGVSAARELEAAWDGIGTWRG
ncbi:hypothetical protein [Streptomyces sp. NBC_01716]|uniref:hypothetical protein n=1 Tax=Streptomyces sp. NBC_01716 TaxID=2975917 RepID=UPI002E3792E8|nr:hypothetical protein [Streptomyces sp. NBC_01716]